ncbi:MAG TPA: hypothetical protein VI027_16580 [Rubrobacteraceae bacterium]
MSGLYEVLSWLIYTLAAVMMLAMIAAAILTGLALRFVAGFLRELGDGHEEDDTQHAQDSPRTPTVGVGSSVI